MNETKRIADQLRRSQQGTAWHGPAVGELLKGVDAAMAERRVLPAPHNIWELVLHITAWQTATLLRGERRQDAGNWTDKMTGLSPGTQSRTGATRSSGSSA